MSSPHDDHPLEARVEALEERVAGLADRVRELTRAVEVLRDGEAPVTEGSAEEDAPDVESPEREPVRRTSAADDGESPSLSDTVRRSLAQVLDVKSEDWLSRVGIGLLLFGLVFLFRYAVDVGWLVPEVRVGFGAVLGGVLLAGGLRVYAERRRLGQVLLGGSSAVFYATVFAAYQLYAFLPYPYAFAAMTAITAWTFVLGIQQDDALLSVTGLAGGLATPFLLYTDAGHLPGFVAYVCLVLTGGTAIYFVRGWRSLLWTSVAGGWLVMAVTVMGTAPEGWDRWAVQGGLAYAWMLLGGVPVLRAVLEARRGDGDGDASGSPASWWERELVKRPPYVLVNASPLLALAGTRLLWEGMGGAFWGGLALAGAGLYAGGAAALYRMRLDRYASAHALAASVLVAYGCSEALGGATLLLVLAAEAAALTAIGTRLADAALRRAGHGLMLVVAVWWIARIAAPEPDLAPILTTGALSELAVLGLVGAVSWQLRSRRGRDLYRLAAHAGWLAWWWNELVPLANGQAYVSAAWGLTAVAALVTGTWRRAARLQYVGLATLALFVGKLFLVDLAALPALWRIALFLASGGLFLVLSYSLPGLMGD